MISKNIMCVTGNYATGCLCIYIDCGANDEPKDKNGLSHLCEHFYIKLLSDKYLSAVQDVNFRCVGYTDYMYTVITILFTENEINFNHVINALEIKEKDLYIGQDYFEKSRTEIISECKIRNKHIAESVLANSYLTNGKVNYVPLGKIDSICSINYKQFAKFFIHKYCNFQCFCLLQNSYKGHHKSQEVRTLKCRKVKNKSYKVSVTGKYLISNLCKQKIYYRIMIKDCIYNLCIAILEYIIENKVLSNLGISFMKKCISKKFMYEIICIDSREENIGIKIHDLITEYKLKESDIYQAKREIILHLKNNKLFDLNHGINNIINHLVYNENFLLNDEQICDVIVKIESITFLQLQQIKKEVFHAEYCILLGY